MSMLASSRRVPHVDLEPLAAIAIASRAAILIFDLIGVRKSKPRGSPRLLHVENRKNQNPVSSGRVRTAGRASDINQCFLKIRTSTENLGFCSRKSKEIKNSAEILGFVQKNIKQIKQFKRRCPQTRNARRARGEL